MGRIGAKTNSPLVIIADADAIVAQVSSKDSLHIKAVTIAEKLVRLNARILYPVTAITEATTHIQRVLSNGVMAYSVVDNFIDPQIAIIEVNQETIKSAMRLFSPKASKKATLYDCIVAAIARERRADAIFSFDKFYQKNGFKLASEL